LQDEQARPWASRIPPIHLNGERMSDQNAQEPTMEEILASIRRIISEDEPGEGGAAVPEEAAPEPAAAAPAPFEPEPEPEDDVLVLTDPIAPPPLESHGDLDIYTPDPVEEEPAPPAYEAPPEAPPAPSYAPSSIEGALVSDETAYASASAFAALGSAITMPAPGRTLEDVVKELLNPLLKAWLDQNLPRIVEAKVQEEVQRIARGR
jgi:cell pole-organizing protein PopZ